MSSEVKVVFFDLTSALFRADTVGSTVFCNLQVESSGGAAFLWDLICTGQQHQLVWSIVSAAHPKQP